MPKQGLHNETQEHKNHQQHIHGECEKEQNSESVKPLQTIATTLTNPFPIFVGDACYEEAENV